MSFLQLKDYYTYFKSRLKITQNRNQNKNLEDSLKLRMLLENLPGKRLKNEDEWQF